ncbi:MAG: hypothetical protein EOO16_08470 [Chitinophagaceae bacterium]|nr:MAG: hypothetical protein EOO16_08470 [Chitinophagaceae bacterium]
MKKSFNFSGAVRAALILCCALLSVFGAQAQSESYVQMRTGVLRAKDTCTVVDEKFADPQWWETIRKHQSVTNVVGFELRFDTALALPKDSFRCTLIADIFYKDSLGQDGAIRDVKLEVAYDTVKGRPYQGMAYYKFTGGHQVSVVVRSITSRQKGVAEAPYFRISNKILVERQYKPRKGDEHSPILLTGSAPGNTATMRVELPSGTAQRTLNWNFLGFETNQYDLEYTFYDYESDLAYKHFRGSSYSFGPAVLAEAFRNNATRITLSKTSHTLNMVFPKGFLLVRIRSFEYVDVDGEQDRKEYPWRYMSTSGIDGAHAVYRIDAPHEGNLTWQYNAVFAEDGKQKEVVSYLDGALKSRQTVTINNSDNTTVVQETILDRQNRPAISVLPAPTTDNTLHFFPAFNKKSPAEVYDFTAFDVSGNCLTQVPQMHEQSGAARYYSPFNPFVGNQAYPFARYFSRDVPVAEGYPFAVTEYSNDLTNRVRRQGGVGLAFQLGRGHETRYFYGKPLQSELDRLFGSEAGVANHYSKNMVVDANGQVSVSYVDMAGKTVATALAGNAPQNLTGLPLPAARGTIFDELVRPQGLVRDAGSRSVTFHSTVLVPVAADYNFKYHFSPKTLELLLGMRGDTKVCADCYYDVRLSISDICGKPVKLTIDGREWDEVLVPASFNYGSSASNPGKPNIDCAVVPPDRAGDIMAAFLEAGEYKVSYSLTMNAGALESYMEHLKQLNVVKTPKEFKKEYMQTVNLAGCFTDCKTCTAQLGTPENFRSRIAQILEQEEGIVITTDDYEWIGKLYTAAQNACSQAVARNCTEVDGCADQRKMMLKDVTPGGQYGMYDPTTLLFKERNINAFLKAKAANDGQEVLVNRGGVERRVAISQLAEAELIANWKAEWAYLLLKYHPEWHLLEQCRQMSASRNRERRMMNEDNEEKAHDDYKWRSLQELPADPANPNHHYGEFLAAEYSLFVAPFNASNIATFIDNRVRNFATVRVNGQPKTISLREFIQYTIYCNPKPVPTAAQQAANQLPDWLEGCGASPACPRPLDEWRLFRSIYTGIKQEALRQPDARTACSDCNNCYIGVNVFSSMYNERANPDYYPKLSDFVVEPDGQGLQVRYRYTGKAVNNRCNVTIYKAVQTASGVVPTQVAVLKFQENQMAPMAINGASADEVQLYYVEQVINNYNHNLDDVNPTNIPTQADFEYFGMPASVNVRFVGKYPLLNKVEVPFQISRHHCEDGDWRSFFCDPFWQGPLTLWPSSNCDLNHPNTQPVININTKASCISDARWPSYFQKKRRFYESNDVADINTVLGQGNSGNGNTPMGSTAANFQTNCANQADGWLEKLKSCGALSATNDPSGSKRAELRARLIAVCVGGADQMHPYGSSTTADGQPTAAPYNDRSFKDAIVAVLGPESLECNSLLIDFPVPYGDVTSLSDEFVNKLKQCGYDLLVRFRSEWQSSGGSTTEYPTLQAYIRKAYDPNFPLSDAQITELVDNFGTPCPLKRPIPIPGLLTRCDNPQTPSCLDCGQLRSITTRFSADYPQVPQTAATYYDLLAAYINRSYQMNVAPSALYAAVEKCKARSQWSDTAIVPCAVTCEAIERNLERFVKLFGDGDMYCWKAYCGGTSNPYTDRETHMATWLNIALGVNYTFQYYNQAFPSCIKPFLMSGCPDDPLPGWTCDNPEPAITCCDDPGLSTFKALYPGAVDPRLLAYFFEIQRYRVNAPANLPNISYQLPYSSLVNYFNNMMLPNVVPYCAAHAQYPAACALWNFTFTRGPVGCGSNAGGGAPGANAAVLCTTPLVPLFQSDPDECLRSSVRAGLSNAEYAYSEYVETVTRDYREAYFAKCLSVTPSLVMAHEPLEYHYTLYYYDQSGNLVKTVAPHGLEPIRDQDSLKEVAQYRDEQTGDCYKNSGAPHFGDPGQHAVRVPAGHFPGQGAGPLTVEAWVRFEDVNSRQVLIDQFDDARKLGYYAYIENGQLHFNLRGRSAETWIEKRVNWLYPTMLPSVPAHYYSNYGIPFTRNRAYSVACRTEPVIPTDNKFHHIVFQYSGDPADPRPVKVLVDGSVHLIDWTNSTLNGVQNGYADSRVDVPSTQVPTVMAVTYQQLSIEEAFTTAANTELVVGTVQRTFDGQPFDGLQGKVKQLRIYHALPEAADLRRNSFEECLLPSARDGLVLWLPLSREHNQQTVDLVSGGSVPILASWDPVAEPRYPNYAQPTYYAYNSLNQVVRQKTPDAGETRFWYDRLGRLLASQNAEQLDPQGRDMENRFSYTRYDAQGRISEVGEKVGAESPDNRDLMDPDEVKTWLNSGQDRQVTQTVYDEPDPLVTTTNAILTAQLRHYSSRKRVATSIYREEKTTPADFNFATHYVYDVAGNVKRLFQEHKKLPGGPAVATMKTVDYEYDLASGKMNRVFYQKGQQDQYIYHYEYDADNRLEKVLSGRDAVLYRDALYKYYLHGPLARTELGHDGRQVQGVDYAYTLQGWLKGINGLVASGPKSAPGSDMGGDGEAGTLYASFPRDAYAYTLGYFEKDYEPVGSYPGAHPIQVNSFQYLQPGNPGTGLELFNGNIAYTTHSNRMLLDGEAVPYSYRYDQLNRLVSMRSHPGLNGDGGGEWSAESPLNVFAEDVTYDANGNILSYTRNGSEQQEQMDQLTYHYPSPYHNKLDHVHDEVDPNYYVKTDIDAQDPDNYTYDQIGNIIRDRSDNDDTRIEWTVYGKIRRITKANAGVEITYAYDAAGNRISKRVQKGGGDVYTTYYFRDAQGNVLGVYGTKGAPTATPVMTWKEQHLYGSNRLGMWKAGIRMDGTSNLPYETTNLGSRQYELSNHLGNVLSVISDKIVDNGDGPEAEVLVARDYYPFGMLMPDRSYTVPAPPEAPPGGGTAATPVELYRHGFATPVAGASTTYSAAPNVISPYLSGSSWSNSAGAFISYPSPVTSGPQMDNCLGIALTPPTVGADYTLSFQVQPGYKLTVTSFSFFNRSTPQADLPQQTTGFKYWSMTINGIPVGSGTLSWNSVPLVSTGTLNVSSAVQGLTGTITVLLHLSGATNKSGTFRLDNFVLNGYMEQVGGNSTPQVVSGSYRYGFNGKENDDEVWDVEGGLQDYGARIYDPRVGRWLSLDPLQKKYPNESNYAFVSNIPTIYQDPDGKDKILTIVKIGRNGRTTVICKIDKNYFLAERQSRSGGGFDYAKYSVSETQVWRENEKGIYVQEKDKTDTYVDRSNPDFDASTLNWTLHNWGMHPLAEQKQVLKEFGFVLTGNSAGDGWTLDLGGDAIHIELLRIGALMDNIKNMRELEGKQEISDAFETVQKLVMATVQKYMKVRGRKFMVALENIDDAKGAAESASNTQSRETPATTEPAGKPAPVHVKNGKVVRGLTGNGSGMRKMSDNAADTIYHQ